MNEKLIGTFTAVDEKGNKYTISHYQNFVIEESFDGTTTTPGTKAYRCSLGNVNHIKDNTFKIVATGIIVKKID